MAALGLTLLVLMPGCGGESVSPGARWREQVRENTSPNHGIDFTWKVRNAPAPFGSVVARAQYDVVNWDECGYVNPATGTAMGMTIARPLPLKKVSSDEYAGTVYLDLLRNESYYGKAKCKWGLTGVGVLFRATGAADETRFETFMYQGSLVAAETVTSFYPGKHFPRVEDYDSYPSFGEPEISRFTPEYRVGAFSATIESKGDRE